MAATRLNVIRLSGVVGRDRKLIVQLPLDVPDGPVKLVMLLPETPEDATVTKQSATESEPLEARTRKLAELRTRVETTNRAGSLRCPDSMAVSALLSDTELMEIGKLPPGARPSYEMIIEDHEDRI